MNPTLTPSEVASGKGMGFIPSAVDSASSHLGRILREINKGKGTLGLNSRKWLPCEFECITDEIDQQDNRLSGDSAERGMVHMVDHTSFLQVLKIKYSLFLYCPH